MPSIRLLILVLCTLTVCSCASFRSDLAEKPVASDANESAATKQPVASAESELVAPQSDLDPDLMLTLLVGEVAGQRGDLNTAIKAYVAAARESEDPVIAERAVQIALFGQDLSSAKQALDVLLEVQPDQALTHHIALGVYLRDRNPGMALQYAQSLLELSESPLRSTLAAIAAYVVREAEPEVALTVMKGLVTRVSDQAGANFALSQVARHYKQESLAEAAAKKAIESDPDWPAPYVQLAAIYDQSDRTDEALILLEKIAPHHDDRSLLMAYGQLLAKAERLEPAAQQFQKILKQQDQDHAARMALALVRMQQQKLDQAEKQLDMLVDVDGYHDRAAYYLGRIARWNQQYDRSIRWFEAVGEGPMYLEAQSSIAVLKAAQGDLDAARAVFAALREQMPDKSDHFYLLEGELLYEAEAFVDFYRLMNVAVKAYPENMKLRYSRALAAVEVDHLEVLESDLKLVLSKDPGDVDALNALGFSLASETERFEEASRLLEKAIQIRPDDPAILDSVGWLRYRQGQFEVALDYLKRAYNKFPDDEIAAHLGEVLWALGRKQDARDLWKKASESKPDSRHIQDVLERFK